MIIYKNIFIDVKCNLSVSAERIFKKESNNVYFYIFL